MELVLDHATRDFFDKHFERLDDKVDENRVEIAKIKQEVHDLKQNGYFVKPHLCQALHEKVNTRIRSLEVRIAVVVAVATAAWAVIRWIL